MERLKISYPVIVEGKYDKIKLSSVIDAQIVVLDGFRVFKEKEKKSFLCALSEKSPLIVLTDSDGAGLVIRNFLRSFIPKDRLIDLYVPEIEGKEKRKTESSKEGLLGVEGIDDSILYCLFEPFVSAFVINPARPLTRADLYDDGLLGGKGSSEKRKRLCKAMSLPTNISTSSLVEALTLLCSYDEYKAKVSELFSDL